MRERKPEIGEERRFLTGKLNTFNGGVDGWLTIHEDDDAEHLRSIGRDTNGSPFLPPVDPQAEVARLAQLDPLAYELERAQTADRLGLRVSILDTEVAKARPRKAAAPEADVFEAVEPWPSPVDGAALLAEMMATILRFCVLPEYSAPLMAAWVLHAWAHDAADISPILALVSPEKRCGKTTALNVVGAMVPKAMHAVNITSAVLFRVVEKFAPTVLVDEADTFIAENDELRGILNGGHNRLSAYVWRNVGDDHEPRRFRVWAPKAIAMVGKLPDTLEDRAIVVHLRRKRPAEAVERFRADRVHDLLPLRRRAARWAVDNQLRLRDLDPALPDELNDRAQDNARALCAIADVAGGVWPQTIEGALLAAARQTDDDEPQTAGALLLRDISEIMDKWTGARIGSSDLVAELCAMEEAPWSDWRRGAAITARGVSKLLEPFGVRPRRDRVQRFYAVADFADALQRYVHCPGTSETSVGSVSSVTPSASVTESIRNIRAVTDRDARDVYSECDGRSCHHDTIQAVADDHQGISDPEAWR